MSDRAKKISELDSITSATANDLIVIVNQPGTANVATKKITVANFLANSISTLSGLAVSNTANIVNLNVTNNAVISNTTITSANVITLRISTGTANVLTVTTANVNTLTVNSITANSFNFLSTNYTNVVSDYITASQATLSTATSVTFSTNTFTAISNATFGNSSVNTFITPTLVMTAVANVSSSINVGANVNLSTTYINVGNSTVNTYITSGAIDTDGTLAVLGAATFSNTVNITGLLTGSNASISGTANVGLVINVGANSFVSTTTHFVGNSTSNSSVNSTAIFTSGILQAQGNTTLYSNTGIGGILTVSNNISVTGTATFSGGTVSTTSNTTLSVSGMITAANNLTVIGYANVTSYIYVGSNTYINTTAVQVGNFTANSTTVSLANVTIFTGSANTRSDVLSQVGNTSSNGSMYLSTAGKMYLKVNSTGVSSVDWQKVTTSAAD